MNRRTFFGGLAALAAGCGLVKQVPSVEDRIVHGLEIFADELERHDLSPTTFTLTLHYVYDEDKDAFVVVP